MNNSEFDLVDMVAIREVICPISENPELLNKIQVVHFPSSPDNMWPMIIIRINMRRRPLFYVFNHVCLFLGCLRHSITGL